MPNLVKVIVKTPVWDEFDYLLPETLAVEIGQRIVVPFGKRQVVGIVDHFSQETTLDANRLKPITDCLDDRPILDAPILSLCRWASRYYHYPLGEVVFGMLPKKAQQCRQLALAACQSCIDNHVTPSTIQLSAAQQHAMTVIDTTQSGVTLLHGVTGSGKTEVYLQLIAQVLRANQQALVLVPEISLTPQTVQRFKQRFDVPIATVHSGLTDKQRLESWLQAQRGEAGILIGTRSAIFTPMPRLGLIVVDEEHDLSFKQQSGFRYAARDVAVMRAHQQGIPVIMGSATPSLESLHNAWYTKRYHYVHLPERAGSATLPRVSIHDIRQDTLVSGMGTQLLARLRVHLAEGGQVLLFLNRRGFAPVLLCHHCGFSAKCPHCETYLTYHQSQRASRCHHCDYTRVAARICPECHQSELQAVGLGTEQLEDRLNALFPDETVLRIDRDTTRRKGALENLLQEAHNQSASILIGTQMLAKGHHFKNLTLAAVIDADSGLMSADFRALERLAQLLVQVAGRAGREASAGEVIIQTHQPDHPLLNCLLKQGYSTFAKTVLADRQGVGLPPFAYLAMFRSEGSSAATPNDFLAHVRSRIEAYQLPVDVMGPMDAPMAKKAGKFRAQLLLRSVSRSILQQLLTQLMRDDWLKQQKRRVSWSLDIDPMEMA